LGVVAPWCVSVVLIVSFAADAEQDASMGASTAPIVSRAPDAPLDLVPGVQASIRGHFRLPRFGARDLVRQASLTLGDPADFAVTPDEIDPRIVLKKAHKGFPTPNRAHKSDPFLGLRPTFDAKLRKGGSLAAWRMGELMMSSQNYLAFDGLAPPAGKLPADADYEKLEPWSASGNGATQPASGDASPGYVGASLTLRSGEAPRNPSGATPEVPRAVALGSTTPAPDDQTPIEVAAVSAAPRADLPGGANATLVPQAGRRPNYAALIDQDKAAREERCLAQAIYFEARGESEEGQAAVAQVVLNRVSSGLYPTTVCGVVYQNRRRHNACQFSFACDGHSLRITEPEAWAIAQRVAHDVTDGKTYNAEVGGATHYHANYVRPRWARRLQKMDVIGNHIFYKLRPGQT
jgi:spore germination cell wall hydrolase CwlJ-like protein